MKVLFLMIKQANIENVRFDTPSVICAHLRWPPSSAACSWMLAAPGPGWFWSVWRRPGGRPSGLLEVQSDHDIRKNEKRNINSRVEYIKADYLTFKAIYHAVSCC